MHSLDIMHKIFTLSLFTIALCMTATNCQLMQEEFDGDGFIDLDFDGDNEEFLWQTELCDEDKFAAWMSDIQECEQAVAAEVRQNRIVPMESRSMADDAAELLSGLDLLAWGEALTGMMGGATTEDRQQEIDEKFREESCQLLGKKLACFDIRAKICLDSQEDIDAYRLSLVDEWFQGFAEMSEAAVAQMHSNLGDHISEEELAFRVQQRLDEELTGLLMSCPALAQVKDAVLGSMVDPEGPCSLPELESRDEERRECLLGVQAKYEGKMEAVENATESQEQRAILVETKCSEQLELLECERKYKACLSREMLRWVEENELQYFLELEESLGEAYPEVKFSYAKDCVDFEDQELLGRDGDDKDDDYVFEIQLD